MEDIVRNIYNELLVRDPDSEGLKLYTDMMNAGHSKDIYKHKSTIIKHISPKSVLSKI